MDRAAHGWVGPENARRVAAEFSVLASGGFHWLPPRAMELLHSLPLGRRRLTAAEAAAAPARIAGALRSHGLTLGSWHGPGWAKAIFGRTDPERPAASDYHFQALRIDADRRRISARLHNLPFLLTNHAMVRFLSRTGRDPELMFGPELLAALRYAVACGLLLGRRANPAAVGGLHFALSFGEGAILGKPSYMTGAEPGSLPGARAIFGRFTAVSRPPNPSAMGSPVLPAGWMATLEATTFVRRNRLGSVQKEVGDGARDFGRRWAGELAVITEELYLEDDDGGEPSAKEVLARHPRVFEELEAVLKRDFRKLAEAEAAAEERARARPDMMGGHTGTNQQEVLSHAG